MDPEQIPVNTLTDFERYCNHLLSIHNYYIGCLRNGVTLNEKAKETIEYLEATLLETIRSNPYQPKAS